jgi:site-specific recombinase XerC
LGVVQGKFGKDRGVCVSNDTLQVLVAQLKKRRHRRSRKVFLVERGRFVGQPISVRGIQKRVEYYAQQLGGKFGCTSCATPWLHSCRMPMPIL